MENEKFGFYDFIDHKVYAMPKRLLKIAGFGLITYKMKKKLRVFTLKFRNDPKTYIINEFTFKRALKALKENGNVK